MLHALDTKCKHSESKKLSLRLLHCWVQPCLALSKVVQRMRSLVAVSSVYTSFP